LHLALFLILGGISGITPINFCTLDSFQSRKRLHPNFWELYSDLNRSSTTARSHFTFHAVFDCYWHHWHFNIQIIALSGQIELFSICWGFILNFVVVERLFTFIFWLKRWGGALLLSHLNQVNVFG